jgi:uncharacterized protein
MIIFDSSPLIHLTKIGKLDFIIQLFQTVNISETVYDEVVIKGRKKGYSDADIIDAYVKSKQIIILTLPNNPQAHKMKQDLQEYLHKGERDAIILGMQNNALIAIDERKGRIICEQHNISTITTASLLLLLVKKEIIKHELYTSNFAKYAKKGWISLEIYQEYLTESQKENTNNINKKVNNNE